jgi:hypothetical protein
MNTEIYAGRISANTEMCDSTGIIPEGELKKYRLSIIKCINSRKYI